jgi:hypothetical protein
MSPEQLSGDQLDGRSDLYSLALVLYRMLSGKLPFEATTVQETMIKRLTDEPTTLAEARPDLSFPAGLQPVIDTALARTPTDRYQTVAKFAADIGAVTGRPPARSVPPTDEKTQLLERVPAAAKKRSFVPVVLGLGVVLVGGGAWIALSGGNKAGGTPPDSAVAQDTASNRPTPQNSGGAPPAALPSAARGADSATIDKQLDDVLELVLDPQTAGTGRIQATAIYDNERAPVTLRAQAAFMVAQAFFLESRADQACRWNALALRLSPSNAAYLKFNRDQGCPA